MIGRTVDGQGDYRVRYRFQSNSSVGVTLMRGSVALMAEQVVPGLTYNAGDRFAVRLDVKGAAPTRIGAKIWAYGTPEPSGWQVETTDNTAGLQQGGYPGVYIYASGTATNAPYAAAFDDLAVKNLLP